MYTSVVSTTVTSSLPIVTLLISSVVIALATPSSAIFLATTKIFALKLAAALTLSFAPTNKTTQR
jgi:hypothetical protein